MAQNDYNVANSDGATVRADLNSVFSAIVSSNSGASAPATTFAYQWWADTTNSVLKQRNAANSAWLVRGPLAAAGVLAKTAAYTVALGDFGKLIDCDASGSDFTITLPAAATAGDGFPVAIENTGSSGTVTIDGNASETIDGATTVALGAQYDSILLRCDGSNWHIVADKRPAASGIVLQSITANIAAATGSTTIPNDNTTPLSSEGTQLVSQAITPADNTNKVRLTASVTVENASVQSIAVTVFRGSTAIGAAIFKSSTTGDASVVSFDILDSPASASAQTYSLRIGSLGAGTWYANRRTTAIFNGEMAKNAMTLQEIVA